MLVQRAACLGFSVLYWYVYGYWVGSLGAHLDVAGHVILDWLEGYSAQDIEKSSQALSSLEKVGRLDSFVIGLVNGDIDEALVERVEEGSAWGDCNCHCGVCMYVCSAGRDEEKAMASRATEE